MNQDIINYLLAYPEVPNVYFGADGAWAFSPRLGFDKVVSRAEALGESKKEEEIKKPLKTKEKE